MMEAMEEIRTVQAELGETRVTLVDILIILARGKWIWLGCSLLCGMVALVIAFLLPVEYQAETDILPPQQSVSSTSMLMGQVSGLLGMGANSSFGFKDPNDVILTILRSRTIADALIDRFDLKHVYGRPDLVLAEITLARHSRIFTTLQGSIAIIVEDRDPKLAAALANAYVDQLYKQNERFAYTEAAQRRLFFQRQIENEKDRLEDAEVALKETELKTGVIEIQGQTAIALRRVADLRAQITSSQVQLKTLLTYETPNNPEAVRLQEQISSLQAALNKTQSSTSKNRGLDGVDLPTTAVPGAALDYVRKLREVKYHEELFNLLTRQLEAAKLDESKEAPAVQVIDPAVPPHFPFYPRRPLIGAIGFALGLVLGWVYTIAAEITRRTLEDPSSAAKWWSLRKAILD